MRKLHAVDALFPRTRQAILAACLMHSDRWWYLSDLANHLGVRASSLQRELASLTGAGVLHRRRDGNRVYYRADPACPFLSELRGLILKTVGLVDVLRDALLACADRISWAFVYGSIARGTEVSTSDVDLMVIGEIGLKKLTAVLPGAEAALHRTINPVVYTQAELAKMWKRKHHFLRDVLAADKLFIVGRGDELEDALGITTRSETRHEPSGAE